MSKNSGYLVETKSGKRGRTYHRENLVNQKMVVYLIDDNDDNIINEDNKELKMLCDPKTIKIIGYID